MRIFVCVKWLAYYGGMKATIYARISKDLQQRAGVERQLSECKTLCEQRGYTVVSHHEDNDISAFSGKPRPGYKALLAEIKRGNIDVVVCWHTDRLYRRPTDLEELIDACDATNTQIETVNSGGLDLSTSTGRMMARQLAVFSGYEVEHQIERQKAAHNSRARKGLFRGGKIPFGFVRGEQPGTLGHHPVQAPAIRQAARDIVNGRTAMSIAKDWVKNGVAVVGSDTRNKFGAAHVRRRLTNPKVAGFEHHYGELFKATGWEPIIDEATWRVVCEILKDPKRNVSHAQERRWLGSGLFYCGRCGSKLGTIKRSKNNSYWARSYTCFNCMKLSRSMHKVDDFVVNVLLAYIERERLEVLESIDAGSGEDGSLTDLQTERQALEARKSDLVRMFTKGTINGTQLEAGTVELDKDISAVTAKISRVMESSPTARLLTGGDLRESWEALSIDQKSLILDEFMTVTILPTDRRGGDVEPSEFRIEWK